VHFSWCSTSKLEMILMHDAHPSELAASSSTRARSRMRGAWVEHCSTRNDTDISRWDINGCHIICVPLRALAGRSSESHVERGNINGDRIPSFLKSQPRRKSRMGITSYHIRAPRRVDLVTVSVSYCSLTLIFNTSTARGVRYSPAWLPTGQNKTTTSTSLLKFEWEPR
jgi:hypothetical protein